MWWSASFSTEILFGAWGRAWLYNHNAELEAINRKEPSHFFGCLWARVAGVILISCASYVRGLACRRWSSSRHARHARSSRQAPAQG